MPIYLKLSKYLGDELPVVSACILGRCDFFYSDRNRILPKCSVNNPLEGEKKNETATKRTRERDPHTRAHTHTEREKKRREQREREKSKKRLYNETIGFEIYRDE
jgi:hypothetical protein